MTIGSQASASSAGRRPEPELLDRQGWEAEIGLETQPRDRVGVGYHASYFDGDEFGALRGDPLYGLSSYTQLGGTLTAEMTGSRRAEAGVVLQYGQGMFNGSFLMDFVWGRHFPVPVLNECEATGNSDGGRER